MNDMNLLVTGALNNASEKIGEIESLGHNIAFLEFEKDKLPCDYEWVEGVVCNGLFLHHDIKKFKNLKFIQLTSAGLDRVPLDYLKSHNIKLFNARGVYSVPMAEFAVSGILDFYKNKRIFFENQKKHLWEKQRDLTELSGKTVCILGCGSVGSECAKRLKAFDCEIIGVDLIAIGFDCFDKIYGLDNIKATLAVSDVVILTLPLTETTKRMFNDELFSAFKDNSLFVNVSRGGIVDNDALLRALQGKLSGAVLDVFDDEPLDENSPLWDMENVIITPHNSFVSDKNGERLLKLIIGNLNN